MDKLSAIQQLAILILPVLFAITVHEAAHGWAARRLGDNTAYMLGRITLNPIRHIDPIGTIAVPLAMFFLGGLLFGWARPVPVAWQNLGNPRRDMALVAVAGPGSNLVMALLWALVMRAGYELQSAFPFATPLLYMGWAGIMINANLMVLNLLPVLPLDGGRITASLLPPRLSARYGQLEPWGLPILLLLIFSGLLWVVMGPAVLAMQNFSYAFAGLN